MKRSMNPAQAKVRWRGVTLIELVVTMMILLTVVTTITAALVSATNTEADQNNRFQTQQQARLALTKLTREIHCASVLAKNNRHLSRGFEDHRIGRSQHLGPLNRCRPAFPIEIVVELNLEPRAKPRGQIRIQLECALRCLPCVCQAGGKFDAREFVGPTRL